MKINESWLLQEMNLGENILDSPESMLEQQNERESSQQWLNKMHF